MTGKIKRVLKYRLFTKCLYEGQINGLEYRVTESKSPLPFFSQYKGACLSFGKGPKVIYTVNGLS